MSFSKQDPFVVFVGGTGHLTSGFTTEEEAWAYARTYARTKDYAVVLRVLGQICEVQTVTKKEERFDV